MGVGFSGRKPFQTNSGSPQVRGWPLELRPFQVTGIFGMGRRAVESGEGSKSRAVFAGSRGMCLAATDRVLSVARKTLSVMDKIFFAADKVLPARRKVLFTMGKVLPSTPKGLSPMEKTLFTTAKVWLAGEKVFANADKTQSTATK